MEKNYSDAESYRARRPEERLINDYLLLESAARKVATGLAYLLLTWSTVVLLGGFVSALKLIDFWCLAAISTSFAVNLADLFEYTRGYMLAAASVYAGLRDDRPSSRSCRLGVHVSILLAEALLGVLITVHFVVVQVLTFAPVVAIVLSLSRLIANNYGNVGDDAANSAKLKASLEIFYSLTLVQINAFYFWKMLVLRKKHCASAVAKKCRFGEWGFRLVWSYIEETKTMLERDGAVLRGRNLITFAVGLLGSESLHDRRSALRMLDTFVGDKVSVAPCLLPCRGPLENLMEALEVGDGETRERAARIVAALAGDLRRIDQLPRALHHMASLLQASDYRFPRPRTTTATDARTTTTSMQEQRQRQAAESKRGRFGLLFWAILSCLNFWEVLAKEKKEDTFPSGGGPKQLVSQGLLIVERLARHPANRAQICNNSVLLSKLTAPLFSHAFLDTVEHGRGWVVGMLATSLRIITRLLIRAPGEASRGLRDGITSNAQAVSNLSRVLEEEDDAKFGPELKAAAVDILAELALPSSDRSSTSRLGKADIVRGLWCIFLVQVDDGVDGSNTQGEEQRQQDSTLRKKASEALAQMLSAELRHVAGRLTDMLAKSKGSTSRVRTARTLECLCSHISTEHGQPPRLDAIEMLTKVLQLILRIPCESNKLETADEEQQEEEEFLVALLSLAVVICDGMVDEHGFSCAAPPQDMVPLVRKLKDIIQANNTTTVECLRTVKLTCKLVVSMAQLKPMCIKDFTEHNFMDVLLESLKTLSDLDNCLVLFEVDNHYQVTKTDKPLVSLVKKAHQLF